VRARRRTLSFRPVLETLEARDVPALALTPAGAAAGFSLSTFASGFPSYYAGGGTYEGPIGVAFPNDGTVLATDANGLVYRFPSHADGQVASAATASYGYANAAALAQTSNAIYMGQVANGRVVAINPDGSLNRVVANIPDTTGIAVNPANGHLFVSDLISTIWDVDPGTGGRTAFAHGAFDGVATDGITLYGASLFTGSVIGFNISNPSLPVTYAVDANPDGIALGTGSLAGNLFVNTNYGNVWEVNVTTHATTLIASGGSRGDFVTVDLDGTLLLTQSTTIERLHPPAGGGFLNDLTTSTTASASPGTAVFGQPVTVTATVTANAPGAGTPTGTVTFMEGTTTLGNGTLDGTGHASITTSSLSVRGHTITATYSGDSFFAGSSGMTSETVNPDSTTTAVAAAPTTSDFGQAVTFTATVTANAPGAGTPTGIVIFMDGATPLGTGTLDGTGHASITTSSLSVGSQTITATYGGDGNFTASLGTTTETVNAPISGPVSPGQTATIGFWQGPNGQQLIRSLNGGPGSTQLGDWLAQTFPHLYGAAAGANDLAGKSNTEVANFMTALFNRTSQSAPPGPPKLDAQVLAAALAVYVTNENLAGTTAAAYGFQVSAQGVGAATFNVGGNGAAFGVADNTTLTVLRILQATDARTSNGLLYDLDSSGTISLPERALREMANLVYTAINQQGDI
jgi:hypothetical protein